MYLHLTPFTYKCTYISYNRVTNRNPDYIHDQAGFEAVPKTQYSRVISDTVQHAADRCQAERQQRNAQLRWTARLSFGVPNWREPRVYRGDRCSRTLGLWGRIVNLVRACSAPRLQGCESPTSPSLPSSAAKSVQFGPSAPLCHPVRARQASPRSRALCTLARRRRAEPRPGAPAHCLMLLSQPIILAR